MTLNDETPPHNGPRKREWVVNGEVPGAAHIYTVCRRRTARRSGSVRVAVVSMGMSNPSTRLRRLQGFAILVGVTVLAAWARLSAIGETSALQDSIGPFLAAARLDGRAHATPYGVLMLPPYWVANLQGGIWYATTSMLLLHALVAPAAVLLARRLQPQAVVVPCLIGIALALDPGLLDTARSGAEGYLAALAVGAMLCLPGPAAWLLFAVAVANHPLALCCAPLLLSSPTNTSRSVTWAAALAAGSILHQGTGWGDPGVGGSGFDVSTALTAYIEQGRGIALLCILGPFVGVWTRTTRRLAVCVLGSFVTLCIASEFSGYIRDHHIRLLTIPALACWAAVRAAPAVALAAVSAGWAAPRGPAPVAEQPGTVSLTAIVGQTVALIDESVHIERVWFDGGPVLEPSALMLDGHLRGIPVARYQPSGVLILVIAGLEDTLRDVAAPGQVLHSGPTFVVTRTDPQAARAWLEPHCDRNPRIGGSWDGYSALSPGVRLEDLAPTWACP